MASSSSAGERTAALALAGAAFFLEKRATVLKVAGLEAEGAVLVAPEKLRGFPSISETPREEEAAAAREAMTLKFAGKLSLRSSEVETNYSGWWGGLRRILPY